LTETVGSFALEFFIPLNPGGTNAHFIDHCNFQEYSPAHVGEVELRWILLNSRRPV